MVQKRHKTWNETWKGQPLWSLYRLSPHQFYPTNSLFFARHRLADTLPEELVPAAIAYSQGLISTDFASLTSIQALTACSLNDLRDAVELIDADGVYTRMTQDLAAGGQINIDTVTMVKEHNTVTVHVSRVYCSSQKRVVDGQDFVALFYLAPDGTRHLLRLVWWKPEGPTHIELARQGVATALAAGLRPTRVAFDNGFLEPNFCRWLSKRKLWWVARVKSDQLFWFGNRWLAAREWAKLQTPGSWHYYRRPGVYARGTLVSNRDFGPVKMVAVKWARSAELKSHRYYLTNAQHWSVREILAAYRARWPIEVCFRDCRQSLGMDRYRFTTPEKVEGHMALVVVAYNFLQEMGRGADMSIGQLKRLAQGRPAKPRRTRDLPRWFTKRAS